uniref:Uncharacterized protein n=1 Tax=Aegilops tauschii subsp. strangulata TaxID=200361 RepID=A0A453GVF2_AEGTS
PSRIMTSGPHLGQVYQKSHVAKNSRRIHQSCPIPSGPITSPEPQTKPRERSIQAGVTRRRLDSSRRRDNQPLVIPALDFVAVLGSVGSRFDFAAHLPARLFRASS